MTAPALRTISTIWLMVVPRTMESSTSSTFLPSNTAGIAFSLRRTLISRVLRQQKRCVSGATISGLHAALSQPFNFHAAERPRLAQAQHKA